jgi:hypothetical protein
MGERFLDNESRVKWERKNNKILDKYLGIAGIALNFLFFGKYHLPLLGYPGIRYIIPWKGN